VEPGLIEPTRGRHPGRQELDPDPKRRAWVVLAVFVFVLGSAGALIGTVLVRQGKNQASRESFVASSTDIAENLSLAIVHEQDLVAGAGSFVLSNPTGSQAAFVQWTMSVGAFARYPELLGLAVVAYVPSVQLSAYVSRISADPPTPFGPSGVFQLIPSGTRPYYCFQSASISRPGVVTVPPGTDLCATGIGPALLSSRDSGASAYLPYGSGRMEGLTLGTPVYRGGVEPTTVSGRRAAFLDWTGTEVTPGLLLASALKGHPDTAVTFAFANSDSHAEFSSGRVPTGAQSNTINLHNGWTLTVLGPPTASGILSSGGGLTLLIAGVGISLVIGLLIEALSRSRGRAVRLVGTRTDQLHYQAFHDSLTGLPNRALILDRIDQMMVRAQTTNVAVAGLYLDIDHFKRINDNLGHVVGDQLLERVAARLSKALREGDTVGRLGGDEFFVLAEGASLAAGPEVVAGRILDIMGTPFQLPGSASPLVVNVSIGIATGYRGDAEDLLRDADIALYQAKALGRNQAVMFLPSMHDVADAHRDLDRDLQVALDEHQFFLLYQPTVNLRTGEFTGAEALLRWHHPLRGVMEPADFIPSLESSGLIIPVGQWVLEEACRQGAAWRHSGYPMVISVNVAALQLDQDRILRDVHHALTVTGFDPDMLILELTETTLMRDTEATIGQLHLLKAKGVRIAIDDFGTGYSSLAYLRKFPIDVLKIDQAFVADMSDSRESVAIVHTLVQLGKLLGLEVTAEGIETTAQQNQLTAEQVDTGQGYLFGRPLDAGAVTQLLGGQRDREVVPFVPLPRR
jgi:diguanylate cyclase (GGDEF)-like protein